MKIFYQGIKGAYSHTASEIVNKELNNKYTIVGVENFKKVWENIETGGIGILPIENSYAGSIHENMYNFLRFDAKIIGELTLDIRHSILSKENKISQIKKVYSHPQAINQCYNFLKKHSIESINYFDTASAALFASQTKDAGIGAIASEEAGNIYGLNNLGKNIQDQQYNQTRFFVVVNDKSRLKYLKKQNKITVLFEARNIPASLYKCLGSFATNSINLTKIESLPSLKNPFSYMFWLDFEGNLKDKNASEAIKELKFFTKSIKILGEY